MDILTFSPNDDGEDLLSVSFFMRERTFFPDDDGEDYLGFSFFNEMLLNSRMDPISRMFRLADMLYSVQFSRLHHEIPTPLRAPVAALTLGLDSKRRAHHTRYENERLRPASFTCLQEHVSWQAHTALSAALSNLLCPAFLAVLLVVSLWFSSGRARLVAGSRRNGPTRRLSFLPRYASLLPSKIHLRRRSQRRRHKPRALLKKQVALVFVSIQISVVFS